MFEQVYNAVADPLSLVLIKYGESLLLIKYVKSLN